MQSQLDRSFIKWLEVTSTLRRPVSYQSRVIPNTLKMALVATRSFKDFGPESTAREADRLVEQFSV